MAPRTPETFIQFADRLRRALTSGRSEIRFGRHHHSHAVCVEAGDFVVRLLETTDEEVQAYLAKHGHFMPEHQELLAKPRTEILRHAELDPLLEQLRALWPTRWG